MIIFFRYELMLDCWKRDPNERPTFSECKRLIGRHLEQKSPSAYTLVTKILSDAWRNLHFARDAITNSESEGDISKSQSEMAISPFGHTVEQEIEATENDQLLPMIEI